MAQKPLNEIKTTEGENKYDPSVAASLIFLLTYQLAAALEELRKAKTGKSQFITDLEQKISDLLEASNLVVKDKSLLTV